MSIDLVEICGEKVADQLSEQFGESAVSIIEEYRIDKLMQVPGLGKKKALNIIRKAYSKRYGEAFDQILSGNAEKTHDNILSLLNSYIVTEDAKNKLLVLFPMNDRELIRKRQDYLEKAANIYQGVEGKYGEIESHLKRISKIRRTEKKKFYDYVIITDSNEALPKLKNPYCDELFVSSPSDAEYAKGSYPFVIYVHGPDSELSEYIEEYADVTVHADDLNIPKLIPDHIAEAYMKNEETIRSIYEILRMLGEEKGYLNELLDLLELYRNKDAIAEKSVSPEELIDLVKVKERELNRQLSKRTHELSVGLDADRILDLISSIGASEDPTEVLKKSLPKEFEDTYQRILEDILRDIMDRTGLDASSLFPSNFSYPASVDNDKLYELRGELEANDFKAQYGLKQKISRFEDKWDDIEDSLCKIYEYDFVLGMGKLISDLKLSRPEISDGGLSFVDGRNLFIDGSIPVSYKIGDTKHDIGTSDRIVVLTGANSGGKTTLLETVLTNQILCQMGLFVPAETMCTTIFDKIRYLVKAKSQNAGAFESTISGLVPLATEKGKRLILIDELESITEPGSAAKIIATLIEILEENKDAFAIIVTHLGEEITDLCNVRVDGIEARGLDDDLNLIVDRQPKFERMGKSTPELIVEKLYRKSKGEKKRVYGQILDKLKNK